MGDTWEEQTKPSPPDGKQSSNCLLSELQRILRDKFKCSETKQIVS